MSLLRFFTTPEVGDHFLCPEGAPQNGSPRDPPANIPQARKNVPRQEEMLPRPIKSLGPGVIFSGLGVGPRRPYGQPYGRAYIAGLMAGLMAGHKDKLWILYFWNF